MSELPPSYFDDLYAGSPDPWGFADRWYEERKRAVTLAALPEPRYAAGFEPGCSIGLLTEGLAARCDALLATDVSEQPLAAARERLADRPHVTVERRAVPAEWPDRTFDLIVLSEMAYYLDPAGLARLLDRAEATLRPGGTLLSVHWRHPVADYPQSGDAVQDAVLARASWVRTVTHVEDDFRLDVCVRPGAGDGGLSVAARTGLL